MYFHIDLLSMLDVQNVQRGMACVDHLQCACVGWVIVAEEWSIVDRKAVAPEVKLAVSARLRCRLVSIGIRDVSRGSVVATKRVTSSCEARGRSLVVTARSRSVPVLR
jgi:hypothetical protein